jgi:hypothetical protein
MSFDKEQYRQHFGPAKQGEEDQGRYTKEMHEQHVAEQEAEEKKAREDSRRRLVKAGYMAAGGNPKDFDASYKQIEEEARRQRLIEAEKYARQAQSESPISRI